LSKEFPITMPKNTLILNYKENSPIGKRKKDSKNKCSFDWRMKRTFMGAIRKNYSSYYIKIQNAISSCHFFENGFKSLNEIITNVGAYYNKVV
jgi:hypothetical protein